MNIVGVWGFEGEVVENEFGGRGKFLEFLLCYIKVNRVDVLDSRGLIKDL